MKPFKEELVQTRLNQGQGIDALAETIRELILNQRVRSMVEERMDDFRIVHIMDSPKWYEELVYCLLTAYASARMGQKCVDALLCDDILMNGSLNEVSGCLISEGHRFAKIRAEYIYNTRHLASTIKQKIQSFNETRKARDWLATNIKGLGLKEASHYLRNVGYFDLAILDRHILANMNEHEIIDHPKNKSLTRKRYLEYEEKLQLVADKLNVLPGELDLYMWYRKTGKVMK